MKTHNIRQAIEWAFKQGVEPIQSSTRFQSSTRLNPDSFHTELIEATLVATSDSVLQSVSDVLRQEPELTLFDNSLMCIGENVRQGPVTYESVAHWLLAQTMRHGIDSPLRWLEESVAGESPSAIEV